MVSSIKPGDRFGMLTVVRRSRSNYALCRCDCGKEKEIQIGKLTCNWTRSCGCLAAKKASIVAERVNQKARQAMVGRVFGRLTVLSIDHWKPAGKRGRAYFYNTQCTCGTAKIVSGNNLVKGGTKSCGCLRKEGHPGYNRLDYGEAAFRACVRVYTDKAAKQKMDFELTEDELRNLFAKSCSYCGKPPSNVYHHPHKFGDFVYTGIDRVDNARGYVIGNVVPCCRQCNVAKNKHSLSEFVDWARRVVAKADDTLATLTSA